MLEILSSTPLLFRSFIFGKGLEMRFGRIVACFGLTIFLGCGSSDGPKLTPIEGTVTYNGQPVASGTIVFFPDKGASGSAEIAAGKISKPTTGTREGVPIGTLRIAVIALEPATPGDAMASRKSLIPEKYSTPETSNETITTVAGKPNVLKIDLKD